MISRDTYLAIEACQVEYARVHGAGHSADWVLGYQTCAKAIMEAIEAKEAE